MPRKSSCPRTIRAVSDCHGARCFSLAPPPFLPFVRAPWKAGWKSCRGARSFAAGKVRPGHRLFFIHIPLLRLRLTLALSSFHNGDAAAYAPPCHGPQITPRAAGSLLVPRSLPHHDASAVRPQARSAPPTIHSTTSRGRCGPNARKHRRSKHPSFSCRRAPTAGADTVALTPTTVSRLCCLCMASDLLLGHPLVDRSTSCCHSHCTRAKTEQNLC